MAKELKLRRGTTVEHSTFTGALGELTIDTTKDTIVVHDGILAGGHALRKEVDSYNKTEVDLKITNLIDAAPGALDTLNELAAALGDDANFAGTVTTALAGKANIDVTSGAVYLGSGTTLQRPTLLSTARAMWYNTDLQKFEGWNGTQWVGVGGGATGGGADTVFVETSYTVTQNYTLTAGKSAMTVGNANGDVTINDGVTVTIPDASQWTILGA